jgi:NADH-quinone oxidoreductase subunit H
MSSLTSILFFGGWLPLFSLTIIPSYIWFSIKTIFFVSLFVIIRAAYPRYRYDQLMRLGWKIFLPLSLGLLILYLGILFGFDLLS